MKDRYVDIDLKKFMTSIVNQVTHHYASDLDLDIKFLKKAVDYKSDYDRWFVWYARECGTQLAWLSEALLNNTPSSNTLKYYLNSEQSKTIRAYIIHVNEFKIVNAEKVLSGDVYEVDFKTYTERLIHLAEDISTYKCIFKDSPLSINVPAYEYEHNIADINYKKLLRVIPQGATEYTIPSLLTNEVRRLNRYTAQRNTPYDLSFR